MVCRDEIFKQNLADRTTPWYNSYSKPNPIDLISDFERRMQLASRFSPQYLACNLLALAKIMCIHSLLPAIRFLSCPPEVFHLPGVLAPMNTLLL